MTTLPFQISFWKWTFSGFTSDFTYAPAAPIDSNCARVSTCKPPGNTLCWNAVCEGRPVTVAVRLTTKCQGVGIIMPPLTNFRYSWGTRSLIALKSGQSIRFSHNLYVFRAARTYSTRSQWRSFGCTRGRRISGYMIMHAQTVHQHVQTRTYTHYTEEVRGSISRITLFRTAE